MPEESEDNGGEGRRLDEALGIDHSEQPGLGGDSSVLEQYGKDTEPDDLPERPVPEAADREPVLPGTDPDVPTDLVRERGGPDPLLPEPGHEIHEGPSQPRAALRLRELANRPKDPVG